MKNSGEISQPQELAPSEGESSFEISSDSRDEDEDDYKLPLPPTDPLHPEFYELPSIEEDKDTPTPAGGGCHARAQNGGKYLHKYKKYKAKYLRLKKALGKRQT